MARFDRTKSTVRGMLPLVLASAALFVVLVVNCIGFASLAAHPAIGKAFRDAAGLDAPIVSAYILLGKPLRHLPLLGPMGVSMANEIAEPLRERISGSPAAAVAVVFGQAESQAHHTLLWCHRLAPWLLLLVAILWWRRPRAVHFVRRTLDR